jgi:DNA-directed RNA polymerase specialized sigma24 family protein
VLPTSFGSLVCRLARVVSDAVSARLVWLSDARGRDLGVTDLSLMRWCLQRLSVARGSGCSRGPFGGLTAVSEFPLLRGDEDELIRSYTPVLDRRLRSTVNTSAANREDAIAFAWTVFLRRQPDRDGPWRAYLSTVARNEAIALDRRDRDHGTLTRVSDRDDPVPADTDRAPPERQLADPHDRHTPRLELSEAVALLAQLPERPRQVAFLRAHSHAAPHGGAGRTRRPRRPRRALEALGVGHRGPAELHDDGAGYRR